MRGAKIAVAIMSAMIVACFVFLVVKIIIGSSGPRESAQPGFAQAAVPMPDDCDLVDSWTDAGRLYLRYDGDGPCRQVVILDLGKGLVLGRVVTEDAIP